MGTKHTPGPWETSINGDGEWDVCGADAGDMIADLSACDNAEANARVIAAAPDLLAALALLDKAGDDFKAGRRDGGTMGGISIAIDAARAAIAKATGGVK